MFKYQTGEDIILGDVVQYAEWQGIIEFFIHKGTSLAIDYHAPNGGLMILFFNGGRILLENTKEEEDLIFKHRFDNSVIAEFEKRGNIISKKIESLGAREINALTQKKKKVDEDFKKDEAINISF